MSKSHNKGQNMKNQNPSDATTPVADDRSADLDSNQSTQSMSGGNDDSTVSSANDRGLYGSSTDSMEGAGNDFGQPVDLQDGQISGSAEQPYQSSSENGGDSYSSSTYASKAGKGSENGLMAKAASILDSQAVKKNLNLVKNKAQDLMASGKDQVSDKYNAVSEDVKLRGMLVNDSIKSNPYPYALGAVGLGFILGRAFSGKGKADLDMLVSTINKLNFNAIGGMLGLKTDSATSEQPNYNSDQARKIG